MKISIHLMLRFITISRMKQKPDRDFNTSHVTVYRAIEDLAGMIGGFQYISCYGLSHVSVNFAFSGTSFQYISCYGLSYYYHKILPINTLFQYISCYGLSDEALISEVGYVNFNTSHVTVYLNPVSPARMSCYYFNTSHVTVYQFRRSKSGTDRFISIHLMLRFIKLEKEK